jgi:hypothetical protein
VFGCINDDDDDHDHHRPRRKEKNMRHLLKKYSLAAGLLAQLKNVDLWVEKRINRMRIRECLVLDCPESGNRTRWGFWVSGYSRHLVV